MIYRGACHCGAVSAAYETDAAVQLRQDGCQIAFTNGRTASATAAHVEIVERFGEDSCSRMLTAKIVEFSTKIRNQREQANSAER